MRLPCPRLRLVATIFLLANAACAPPSSPPHATLPSAQTTDAPTSAVAATPAPSPSCDHSRLAPFARDLLGALEADDPAAAETMLLDRLAVAPTDALADMILDTLREVTEEEREATTKRIRETRAVPLQIGFAAVPRSASSDAADAPLVLGDGRTQPPSPSLSRHGYRPIPADEMRRHRPLPSHLPKVPDRALRRTFTYPDHDVLAQPAGGFTRLVIASRRGRPRVFSAPFSDVASAQLVGDVVLVSLPRVELPSVGPTPRSASQPAPPSAAVPDGLFAFDAASGALLWSAAGVIGAVASGGRVVSAAPGQLEIREVATGKIVEAAALSGPPHALLAHAGKLVVVGQRNEQIFGFERAPAARAAQLEASAPRPPFGGGELACHTLGAAQAFADRDLDRLDTALGVLSASLPTSPPTSVLHGLRRARTRLVAWQTSASELDRRSADRLDLLAVAPTVLASPPWGRMPPRPVLASPDPPTRVVLRRTGAVAFRHWEHDDADGEGPNAAASVAPAEQGKLRPGSREDVPPYLGLSSLRLLVPLGRDALLLYGERWLALVRDRRTEKLFDLEAYRRPPIEKPAGAFDGAPTAVSAATLRGDVLYLCNGGGSYASMARGKTGYVTALDVRTGTLLWQSDPVVCNSELVFWRGYLLTAYGFTSEPDFLYGLRAADGSRVARAGIENTPGPLRLSGDTLTVFTYEKRLTFELSER